VEGGDVGDRRGQGCTSQAKFDWRLADAPYRSTAFRASCNGERKGQSWRLARPSEGPMSARVGLIDSLPDEG